VLHCCSWRQHATFLTGTAIYPASRHRHWTLRRIPSDMFHLMHRLHTRLYRQRCYDMQIACVRLCSPQYFWTLCDHYAASNAWNIVTDHRVCYVMFIWWFALYYICTVLRGTGRYCVIQHSCCNTNKSHYKVYKAVVSRYKTIRMRGWQKLHLISYWKQNSVGALTTVKLGYRDALMR